MIQPQVGMLLWATRAAAEDPSQPEAAVITFVLGDYSINAAGWTKSGAAWSATPIPLLQEYATLLAPTSQTFQDSSGNVWGLAGGQVTLGGKPDTSTSSVIQLLDLNGVIWQQSTATWSGDPTPGTPRWWSKTALGPWLPAEGQTASPLPTNYCMWTPQQLLTAETPPGPPTNVVAS